MNHLEQARAVGIELRSWGEGNHKALCPKCSAGRRNKADQCLSVTIEPDRARWMCHHCQWTGGAGGDMPGPRQDFVASRPQPRRYDRPKQEVSPERPPATLEWFAKRGISAATVQGMGVYRTVQWFPQTQTETPCIAFPYEWDGQLRNVKYRDAAKNFRQEKNPEPVLYNADAIGPAADGDLIFVEGEMDVLALVEAGMSNVVSLPNGAPDRPETSDKRYEPLATHAEGLEKVRRFFIATDMDGPGEFLANELARRLGKDRCWRVTFPNANDVQTKDANECLTDHGRVVLRECIALAKPWPIDGLYGAEDFASDVFDVYQGRGAQPLSCGMGPDMDKAFKVLPGQFVVVTGIPNHGKSRWLDQVAVSMAQGHGWPWAIFSPETGSANHIIDLCEIHAGRPFHPGPNQRMSESELNGAMAWVGEHFSFIDAADHTPTVDWVLERARAAVMRHGIRGLIIDPYNELEAGRPDNMTETAFISQLISKCKRFAKVHDVTVFLVAHPTKLTRAPGATKDPAPGLYDIAGSSHWRNKADAGLVVYRDFEQGCTLVNAAKIRRQPVCGAPGSVKFFFLPVDRRFTPDAGSYVPA